MLKLENPKKKCPGCEGSFEVIGFAHGKRYCSDKCMRKCLKDGITKPNPLRSAAAKRNRTKRKTLTEEGRKKLRESCLRNKPWEKSTGPKKPSHLWKQRKVVKIVCCNCKVPFLTEGKRNQKRLYCSDLCKDMGQRTLYQQKQKPELTFASLNAKLGEHLREQPTNQSE